MKLSRVYFFFYNIGMRRVVSQRLFRKHISVFFCFDHTVIFHIFLESKRRALKFREDWSMHQPVNSDLRLFRAILDDVGTKKQPPLKLKSAFCVTLLDLYFPKQCLRRRVFYNASWRQACAWTIPKSVARETVSSQTVGPQTASPYTDRHVPG